MLPRYPDEYNLLVNQIRDLGRVHIDGILCTLPMRREHHHGTRLHLRRNLTPDLAQLAVGRMVLVEHDIRLG